jgi:hypothetical protein
MHAKAPNIDSVSFVDRRVRSRRELFLFSLRQSVLCLAGQLASTAANAFCDVDEDRLLFHGVMHIDSELISCRLCPEKFPLEFVPDLSIHPFKQSIDWLASILECITDERYLRCNSTDKVTESLEFSREPLYSVFSDEEVLETC